MKIRDLAKRGVVLGAMGLGVISLGGLEGCASSERRGILEGRNYQGIEQTEIFESRPSEERNLFLMNGIPVETLSYKYQDAERLVIVIPQMHNHSDFLEPLMEIENEEEREITRQIEDIRLMEVNDFQRDLYGVLRYINRENDLEYILGEGFTVDFRQEEARNAYINCLETIHRKGYLKNELTEKASDHYPIYAVLEVGG